MKGYEHLKNYYEILGVSKDAKVEEINKAFRKLALKHHTDKGGDEDTIRLLTEARDKLTDPEQRKRFDEEWETYVATGVEGGVAPREIAGLITTFSERFSKQFKMQHAQHVQAYRAKPLAKKPGHKLFKPFIPKHTPDEKPVTSKSLDQVQHGQALTPMLAVDILIDFLKQANRGQDLKTLRTYFAKAMQQAGTSDALLYQGIYGIIAPHKSHEVIPELLAALTKITGYFRQNPDTSMQVGTILLQNKYFRQLCTHVLHGYWQSNTEAFFTEILSAFDGREAAKTMLINLKQMLSSLGDKSKDKYRTYVLQQIRIVGLMYRFDQDLQQHPERTVRAQDLRSHALRVLDWIPAFLGVVTQPVIINTLIQAGVYFQKAAQAEANPAVQMADEALALSLYTNAIVLARRASPNIELYTSMQVLKLLSGFRYLAPNLDKLVKELQERTLVLADIYPLYEPLQPNVQLFAEQDQAVMMLRQFLHTLLALMESNRTGISRIPIDHKLATILYQAYEATLRNWYEDRYDPEQEAQLREQLMAELLAEKKWSYEDVNTNVDHFGLNVERDVRGWMRQSSKLPLPKNPSVTVFRAIDGIEINYNTHQLAFSFREVQESEPDFWKLLTVFDFTEMLEKNLSSGFFSLDGIDPDMQFHPFNTMRFAPSALYRTQLFHSMLFTDYLLKFLTVGREVKGRAPYERRSLDELLQPLPRHLRRIIEDFHSHQRSESMHRFWIEAGEVLVAQDINAEGIHRLALGDIKMVVKKHQLVLDERGNLVDADEADEGWNLYILSQSQREELRLGRRKVESPAMVFFKDTEYVSFFEDGKLSEAYRLVDYRAHLQHLAKAPRDKNEKIQRTLETAWLTYKVTRDVTYRVDKPHHYSPEYCFAQEFTAHYNEFAQYFPEFGRLRELSRVALLINFMQSIYKNNLKEIQKYTDKLNDTQHWQKREREIQERIQQCNAEYHDVYHKEYYECYGLIEKDFSNAQANILSEPPRGVRTLLNELQEQMGSMEFSPYSDEVTNYCRLLYQQNEERITHEYGYNAWLHNKEHISSEILGKRAEYAEQLRKMKVLSWYNQLKQLFSEQLEGRYTSKTYESMISQFIRGNSSPLYDALVAYKREQLRNATIEELHRVFLFMTRDQIEAALEGDTEILASTTRIITTSRLVKVKAQLDEVIAKLKSMISEEKAQIEKLREGRRNLKRQMDAIGVTTETPKVDLQGKCLWVPANVHHDVEAGQGRFVYGGVLIEPKVNELQQDDPRRLILLAQMFGGSGRQARIGSNYLAAARTASAECKRDQGETLPMFLRMLEWIKEKEVEARAYDANQAAAEASRSSGTSQGTGRVGRAEVVAPTPVRPKAAAAGGGAQGGGSGRGSVPTAPPSGGSGGSSGSGGRNTPPPASDNFWDDEDDGDNREPSRRGDSSGDSASGPAGRPPSPTAFFEKSMSKDNYNYNRHNVADALRLNTELAFRQAGILDENGRLTSYAVQNALPAMGRGNTISNQSLIRELTNNGSRIEDWRKFKTPTVQLSSGQRVQIHFYRNIISGEINYTHKDYKVKEVINPFRKPDDEQKIFKF